MKHSIVLKCNKKIKKIKIEDILYVEANGEYSTFHLLNSKPEIACMALKSVEELLTENSFFRISRSHLINVEYCEEVHTNGVNKVLMSDNSELDISREKMKEFKDALCEYCERV